MEIRQTKDQPTYARVRQSYLDALSLLDAPTAPEELIKKTLHTIQQKAHRAWLMRLSSWVSLCVGSCVLSVYSLVLFFTDFKTSGLSDYLGLLWSDGRTILSNFSTQFAYAFVDTLPIFSIVCTLLAFSSLLWSSKKSLTYFRSQAVSI